MHLRFNFAQRSEILGGDTFDIPAHYPSVRRSVSPVASADRRAEPNLPATFESMFSPTGSPQK